MPVIQIPGRQVATWWWWRVLNSVHPSFPPFQSLPAALSFLFIFFYRPSSLLGLFITICSSQSPVCPSIDYLLGGRSCKTGAQRLKSFLPDGWSMEASWNHQWNRNWPMDSRVSMSMLRLRKPRQRHPITNCRLDDDGNRSPSSKQTNLFDNDLVPPFRSSFVLNQNKVFHSSTTTNNSNYFHRFITR